MLTAIVIQGEFKAPRTVQIIEHLLQHNQQALVIVSTWNSPEAELLTRQFNTDRRFKLVQSTPPSNPGIWNCHLQRYSTLIGVKEAEKLGATHVLKMRTDQLLRKDRVCDFLLEQLLKFGEERLVIGHAITTRQEQWGKFHIGDFWMFGKIHHFLTWYDLGGIEMGQPLSKPRCLYTSPESDFAQVWVERRNLKVKTFDELISQYFIIINCDDVELICKTMRLDIPQEEAGHHWKTHRAPHMVRHSEWLEIIGKSNSTSQ